MIIYYREDQVNHCPGCTKSNWYVHRSSAECAFCGTIIPLKDANPIGHIDWDRRKKLAAQGA